MKAGACKVVLGVSYDSPLMETLGSFGKAALVRETEEEWELLIPHALLNRLSFSERVV